MLTLQGFPHPGHMLDDGKLENRLRVVRDRAIRVDGNRDRPHPQKPERDETEGEHGRRDHQRAEAEQAHIVRNRHEADDAESQPVGAEVARDESRQDVERGAALA